MALIELGFRFGKKGAKSRQMMQSKAVPFFFPGKVECT
eukprot:CAMPEP_0177684322 /NCGR_PEP_ID=MMETSP0447-20121125/32364_1 /TAXON_ID=0 /ORGANISM="Stygamoeba regulata, Strain BSH-02190019" /LENGTH=37 /DNA_ID= /DNA_START= /DNA_END= /DNA_ORIENTATION=